MNPAFLVLVIKESPSANKSNPKFGNLLLEIHHG